MKTGGGNLEIMKMLKERRKRRWEVEDKLERWGDGREDEIEEKKENDNERKRRN